MRGPSMIGNSTRYVCVQDNDESWTVVDSVTNEPVWLGGHKLVGKPLQRAETACAILNRIEANRLNQRAG